MLKLSCPTKKKTKVGKALDKFITANCKIGGPLVYLAGPMENTKDLGASWRAQYTTILNANGFDVINPYLLETTQRQLSGMKPEEDFYEIKDRDLPRYKQIMRTIIAIDLEAVTTSDLIICKFNGEKTAGTIHEIGYAYHSLGLPCYLVSELTTRDILGWFLACFEQHAPSLEVLLPIIKRRAGFEFRR